MNELAPEPCHDRGLRELALFAGAGGGILGGVLLGWRCVGAVEIDPYCREVLMARQEEGFLPPFPIWDDVRTFAGKPWRGAVDIVTAGFPCQPWSVAGKRRGKDDERNLWPDTIRVIREVGPRWALLENNPGLMGDDYFGQVLGDLAEAGFDAEWDIVSAEEVGAPHLRERVWILAANADEMRKLQPQRSFGFKRRRPHNCPKRIADASAARPKDIQGSTKAAEFSGRRTLNDCSWWNVEPGLVRMVHGVPRRVDRVGSLGNAQVPRVAVEAWCRLSARFDAAAHAAGKEE